MWLWICLGVVALALAAMVLVGFVTFTAVRRFLRTVKTVAAAVPTTSNG